MWRILEDTIHHKIYFPVLKTTDGELYQQILLFYLQWMDNILVQFLKHIPHTCLIFKNFRSKKSFNKGNIILVEEDKTVNIAKKKKIFSFKNFKGLSFGFFGGIMSGLLGVSGTPPILAGLYNMKLRSVQVVGTSVMVLFFIALSGVITHTAFGHLNWYLVGLLAAGTITGAILGPILGKKIDEKKLEKFYTPFFIVFIFLMGISMFF